MRYKTFFFWSLDMTLIFTSYHLLHWSWERFHESDLKSVNSWKKQAHYSRITHLFIAHLNFKCSEMFGALGATFVRISLIDQIHLLLATIFKQSVHVKPRSNFTFGKAHECHLFLCCFSSICELNDRSYCQHTVRWRRSGVKSSECICITFTCCKTSI